MLLWVGGILELFGDFKSILTQDKPPTSKLKLLMDDLEAFNLINPEIPLPKSGERGGSIWEDFSVHPRSTVSLFLSSGMIIFGKHKLW